MASNKMVPSLNIISEKGDSINIIESKKPKIFFSLDPECPLCKSYSKKINYLHNKYQDTIDFFGFFPTSFLSSKKTDEFIQRNQFSMQLIIDSNQVLTNFLDAKVTPECFFLDKDLNTIYQGLIDDWIKELGRKGQEVKNSYLNDAINSYLNKDSIVIRNTTAIGCIIER